MSAVRQAINLASAPLSLFARLRRPQVIVLGYHMIAGRFPSDFDIAPNAFERHLDYLQEHVDVVSLATAMAAETSENQSERPKVVITFDDAYIDFFETAYPLLKARALPASVFVPVGFINDPARYPVSPLPGSALKAAPCTWPMLQEIADDELIEIGSHTYSHQIVPSLPVERQKTEIQKSRRELESRLSVTVKSFAWPYGYFSQSSRNLAATEYENILRFAGGSIRHLPPHRGMIPRIPIRSSDSIRRFRRKVLGRCDAEEIVRAGVGDLLRGASGYRR